jgi:hypothetical protein
MSRTWEFDRTKWFTTGELLDRGWPRHWFEPIFGRVTKRGPYKLWPRDVALNMEKTPIFIEARAQLDEMAKGGRYLTRDQQLRALEIAIECFDAGKLKPGAKLDIAPPPPLPEAAPSEWPRADWTADALTLTWDCGGKVVIPTPFLEAVRQGLGETGPRLALGVATVLSDWRSGKVKPNSFASGRPYFLTWLRNTLIALQQLETKREFEPEPVPVEPEQPPPTLH